MPEHRSVLPSPVSFLDQVAEQERLQGRRIIRFDIAEPQFKPPREAILATLGAIKEGEFRYSSSWGLTDLRDAVIQHLWDTREVDYSEGEVLITTGGKFANYAFFASQFDRGDKIVLLKPYWASFRAVPDLLGLKLIEIWAKEPYHLNSDRLIEAMAERPKGMVVNSPHNPTGGILDQEDLRLLRDLALDYDLRVLSDEIDWVYTYDGRKHISPASMEGLKDRTVITDGFSKAFAMTGWRVGFAAGPREIISRMHHLQEHSIGSPSTFAQYGCAAALKARERYAPWIRRACERNRSEVIDAMNEIKGLSCPTPEGGFYAYPHLVSGRHADADLFARKLLATAGVSVIPGKFFGDERPTFRLCYALPKKDLLLGLGRMKELCRSSVF